MIPPNLAPYHLQPGQLLAEFLRRIGQRSWPGDLYAIRARRLRHDLERARADLRVPDATVDPVVTAIAADVAELATAVAHLERGADR